MITQEWSITLACILNTYHVETGVSQVQGQPKTHSDFKVRLSYMPRPYFKNSRTEFGSGVKHVQSTHRTWLDPQNCGKMFKNIARCICSLKYDLLPSVLGDLTLSYLSNWEGYPSDKGSSFYQSTNGSTDHEKKGSFFFFSWDSNQTSMEIQRSVTFSHEEVWPIAAIPSTDISSDQTKIQRLLSVIPGGAETEGRAHFQHFHFLALSKSLKPEDFKVFPIFRKQHPCHLLYDQNLRVWKFSKPQGRHWLEYCGKISQEQAHLLGRSFASEVLKDLR